MCWFYFPVEDFGDFCDFWFVFLFEYVVDAFGFGEGVSSFEKVVVCGCDHHDCDWEGGDFDFVVACLVADLGVCDGFFDSFLGSFDDSAVFWVV